jgi:hypothetical protein
VRCGDQPGGGTDRGRQVVEPDHADAHTAPLAQAPQRREHARVLLVAGQDLVAGAEVERSQRRVDAVGRRAGDGELLGVRVHHGRDARAQQVDAPHTALHVRLAAAPAFELEVERPHGRLVAAARHRAGRARVEVLDPLQDGELGAQVVQGRRILGFAPP